MSAPIGNRIRNTVLICVLITFLTTVIAVLIANESLEKTLLELNFQSDYDLILDKTKLDEVMAWNNDSVKVYYLPDNVVADTHMPDIFEDIEPPYAGELEIDGSTFLVTSNIVDGGKFYLAKNISIFEERQEYFHIFLIFLGFFITAISLVMVKIASKHLATPVKRLATEIAQTQPTTNINRINTNYSEDELQTIAESFNTFLEEIESYVKREQSLIGLASHELRTPIAIMTSSMDVIERRDGNSLTTTGPFNRMRKAVDEMAINIDLILKLSRRQSELEELVDIDIIALIDKIKKELYIQNKNYGDRLNLKTENIPKIKQDQFMVKMLLRNLIENALNHTEGEILIKLSSDYIEIQDSGQGLPEAYKEYLNGQQNNTAKLNSLSGLGLFIVSLICERLSWKIQAIADDSNGTTVRITI